MRVIQSIFKFVTDLAVTLVLFVALYVVFQSPYTQMAFQNGLASLEDHFSILQNYLHFAPQTNYGNVDAQAKAVVQKNLPAVVSIYGRQSTSDTLGSGAVIVKVTAGTGFFVDSSGYILTNKHVVSDTSNSYSVVLSNGRRTAADVVFRDPNNDLAILKISGTGYPTVTLGDSSKVSLSEPVVGLGNVNGQEMTASEGEISGLHRVLLANESDVSEELSDIIQITAQLYPGDSGGPLFDLNGNVIGVDVATAVNRANESFAIPINSARQDIQNIIGK